MTTDNKQSRTFKVRLERIKTFFYNHLIRSQFRLLLTREKNNSHFLRDLSLIK